MEAAREALDEIRETHREWKRKLQARRAGTEDNLNIYGFSTAVLMYRSSWVP